MRAFLLRRLYRLLQHRGVHAYGMSVQAYAGRENVGNISI